MSGTKLGIRLFTRTEDLTIGDGVQVLDATRKLLAAVEESISGKPAEIEWVVTAFRYECDGCGNQRPIVHDDWRHTQDGKDFCPRCVASGRFANVERSREPAAQSKATPTP